MAQVSKVKFTTHAAERMQSRLGIKIREGQSVDITSNFVKTYEYTHNTTGNTIQHWCNRDCSQPVVMAIDADTGLVVTVMTTGPIVDKEYSKLNTKQ